MWNGFEAITKRRFIIIMFLCFIFGGYFIISYGSMVQSEYVRTAMMSDMMENGDPSDVMMEFNGSFPRGINGFRGGMRGFQMNYLVSPAPLINLLSGIMFIIAGLSVWSLSRDKEIKELKDEITDMLLLPEEKEIMSELKKRGGEITQKELVSRTGLNKVKVHRILNRMESKKIIRKYPYGTTKKVIIETGKPDKAKKSD